LAVVIVEGIVTTLDERGAVNIAPMGPVVDAEARQIELRPFKTSTTYRNLAAAAEGVFHVVDDALLLARAAIGRDIEAETRPAECVRGAVITTACWYLEFRVLSRDDRADRASLRAEVACRRSLRDFVGWNRAKHAILELAILATRADFLDPGELESEFRRLRVLVEKTGGADERLAYDLLWRHTETVVASRGLQVEAQD
jgi:hypothetical protein